MVSKFANNAVLITGGSHRSQPAAGASRGSKSRRHFVDIQPRGWRQLLRGGVMSAGRTRSGGASVRRFLCPLHRARGASPAGVSALRPDFL